MKKIVLALIAVLTMSANVMAQDAEKGERDSKKMDNTEMVKRRTDALVKRYGLNEQQAENLLELNTKYDGKMWRGPRGGQRMGRPGNGQRRMDGNRQAPDSLKMQDRRPPREGMGNFEEMRKTMEAYDAELKDILTEEQYKQYKADQEERMKRGPQGWGERGNRPGRRQQQD